MNNNFMSTVNSLSNVYRVEKSFSLWMTSSAWEKVLLYQFYLTNIWRELSNRIYNPISTFLKIFSTSIARRSIFKRIFYLIRICKKVFLVAWNYYSLFSQIQLKIQCIVLVQTYVIQQIHFLHQILICIKKQNYSIHHFN